MSALEAVAVLSLPVWLVAEAVLGSRPPTGPLSRNPWLAAPTGQARVRLAAAVLAVLVVVAAAALVAGGGAHV